MEWWNFVAAATDTVTITNGLVNQFIEFDVTVDVNTCILAGDDECNWIVKKPNGQSDRVEFASKEGATTVYDNEDAPQLVVN